MVRVAGENVCLVPLEERDLPQLFTWINDRETVILSAPFKPVSQEQHRRWFEATRQREDMHVFAVRRLDSDELVGTCQLRDVDMRHESAELVVRIGDKRQRGKGVGTEAVRLLLEYGFNQLGLNRIQLHVFSDNLPAIRVYEKVGFIREGVMREHSLIEGERKDALLMAVLRRDFSASCPSIG